MTVFYVSVMSDMSGLDLILIIHITSNSYQLLREIRVHTINLSALD